MRGRRRVLLPLIVSEAEGSRRGCGLVLGGDAPEVVAPVEVVPRRPLHTRTESPFRIWLGEYLPARSY
jgi:hypothetical protein